MDTLMMGDTTPLYLASQRGFSEVAKARSCVGFNISDMGVAWVFLHHFTACFVAQALLDAGADPNFVMPHNAWNSRHVALRNADAQPTWCVNQRVFLCVTAFVADIVSKNNGIQFNQ